ncbi:MAG: extracellular solute-binding protein [Pseudomonadota bacterium]
MRIPTLFAALIALTACSGDAPSDEASAGEPVADAGVLNVYSARHYDSDRLLYAAFEEETGIRVRVRETGAPQLLETMKAEGERSPADLVIASDAGALYRFQEAGLTQASSSELLNTVIPERFRDPDGHWYGLAKRVRLIAYDPERVSAEQVDEYADLADPALEGEVCIRSSSNIYNLSLMGELIERVGADAAGGWAEAVVSNFARAPQGGDTAQIEAVAAGECAVALVNHYYWVRVATNASSDRRAIAEATALSFPSFGEAGTGTHVNVTGAAVAAHAPNKEAAIAFIEFLTTPEGQRLLTMETKEFPLVDGAPLPEGLETLPDFEESDLPLTVLGARQSEAQSIFLDAGWD